MLKALETLPEFDGEIQKFRAEFERMLRMIAELQQQVQTIQQGEQGEQGQDAQAIDVQALIQDILHRIPEPKDGYTPQKGFDYFDGINGQDGLNGKDGKDGKDGADAATPDTAAIIKRVLKLMPKPKDGADAAAPDIAAIIDQLKEKKLPLSSIAGLTEAIAAVRNAAVMCGGGDTVVAGSGIQITNTVNGNKEITATGSGGSLTQETPTGTVDGSNTAFTVLHTPVYIAVDGQIRPLVANITDLNGNGFTYSAGTIMVSALVPPVQFIVSYYNA